MLNFENHSKLNDPSMLSVIRDGIVIFNDSSSLSSWLSKKWNISSSKKQQYNDGSVDDELKMESITKPDVRMNIMYRSNRTISFSRPPTTIEAAYMFCDQLRKDFPELNGKLIFVNEYGEIVRFPFDCSDEELCRRIGLDGEFHDHALMQDFGLE